MAVVSNEDKLDVLCEQMYKALCRVARVPAEWGGKEVREALDAAELYIKERTASN